MTLLWSLVWAHLWRTSGVGCRYEAEEGSNEFGGAEAKFPL
jgi:hypothetical protein